MRRLLLILLNFGVVAAVSTITGRHSVAATPQAATGTIKGHVKLTGKLPGNPVIRMGMDPMCSATNAGKRVVNEIVAAAVDGSMANVFVRLQGNFPQTAVSSTPVEIDQRGCIYTPRV